MGRVLKTIIAIALLVSVVVVFVSPFVDLDPTALGAAKAALTLSLSIAVSAFALSDRIRRILGAARAVRPDHSLPAFSLNKLCSLLC